MNVTREVILDLMPIYLAGEASPATRSLVEEYLRNNPELGRELRAQMVENLAAVAPASLPPDLELKALRRARGLIGWQRWLFGMAISFCLLPLSFSTTLRNGRLTDAHLVARDYPELAVISLAIGLSLWIVYYVMGRRLRTAI